MLDDYGLHGYRVGDNYYYTISSDTKEQLDVMNNNINKLSNGVKVDESKVLISSLKEYINNINDEKGYNIKLEIVNNVIRIKDLTPLQYSEIYTNPKKTEMYLDITTGLSQILMENT